MLNNLKSEIHFGNHIRIIVHGFTYMTHAEQKIVLFLPSMQKIYKSGI